MSNGPPRTITQNTNPRTPQVSKRLSPELRTISASSPQLEDTFPELTENEVYEGNPHDVTLSGMGDTHAHIVYFIVSTETLFR